MFKGEIWWIDLDKGQPVGDEIRKRRPCVIVSDDSLGALALRVVVPCTSFLGTPKPWMVPLPVTPEHGLDRPTVVDAFQVKSVSVDRLLNPAGCVSDQEMEDILAAIQLVLGIGA